MGRCRRFAALDPLSGPAAVAITAGMAAFLQFESLLHAFSAAGVVLLVAGAVGSCSCPGCKPVLRA